MIVKVLQERISQMLEVADAPVLTQSNYVHGVGQVVRRWRPTLVLLEGTARGAHSAKVDGVLVEPLPRTGDAVRVSTSFRVGAGVVQPGSRGYPTDWLQEIVDANYPARPGLADTPVRIHGLCGCGCGQGTPRPSMRYVPGHRPQALKQPGYVARVAVPGGPWTRHGHPVAGVTVSGSGRPSVSRCGGPANCGDCAQDAISLVDRYGILGGRS